VGIAALGVYGLIAYTVKQKTQEIGVRTALGAPRGRIVGHFLRHGVRLTAVGIGIGVILALGASRLMTSVMFGVAATDPVSFTVASVMVMAAALFASLAPAWRAATMDPVSALRQL
jgi:ABC-type antimicrobial peptide transport system permease subunit